MENLLGREVASHHGEPDLFERDIKLLTDYQLWVRTAVAAGYQAGWEPSYIDMLKSRLFWRIRSGKAPLPTPPPTCYSCPWYELIEVPGPHDIYELIRIYPTKEVHTRHTCEFVASIGQNWYEVLEIVDGHTWIVKYNSYKFKAWNGMIPTRELVDDPENPGKKIVIDSQRPGGWIEYLDTNTTHDVFGRPYSLS